MAGFPYLSASMLAVALAVSVLVLGTWRTRSARRMFERMLAASNHPSRRLVEVAQTLRRTRTGHLLLVIDVRSGREATVWMHAPVVARGELLLLVWMEGRWVLMDRLPARQLRRVGLDRRRRFREASVNWRFGQRSTVADEAERFLRR